MVKKSDEIHIYIYIYCFINHDISGSRKIKQPGFNGKYPAVFVFFFFRGKQILEQNVATVICIDFLIEHVMHYHRETGGFKTKESF